MRHLLVLARTSAAAGISRMCLAFGGCADDASLPRSAVTAADASRQPASAASTADPANDPVATLPATAATPAVTTTAASTAPSTTAPPATTAPTTTPPTTEPPNPFSDQEIAARLLLDPEEYGTGWQPLPFKEYELDEVLAASVPACADFIEPVFGSDEVPNTTDRRYFHAPPGRPAAMGQFVIVFPTDAAAEATFTAIADPQFGGCIQQYFELTEFAKDLYCCDPAVPATPPLLGVPVSSDSDFHSDDIAFRTDVDQYWTDASGALHGPEVVDSVTIRVGRTITMIETITVDEFGVTFVTKEQFHSAIGKAVDRARHALAGVEH